MLSEILVLTSTADIVARKKYAKHTALDALTAFTNEQREKGRILPHFEMSDMYFYHIKRQQIHLMASSVSSMAPVCVIQLLTRIYNLLKDFCGSVTERSLSANLILVHEVLDEAMDGGLPQVLSTDKMKPYIQTEPLPLPTPDSSVPGLFGIEHRSAPSDASNKPVIRSKWDQEQRKNEVFLDIVERMNVLIAKDGTATRSEVQGHMTMKSFLIGHPEIRLGLNEDLTIGSQTDKKGYGNFIHLDQLSFHPCVRADDRNDDKVLSIQPPEGEFTLLSYSIHGDLPHGLPFRVYSYRDDSKSTRDIEVGIKLRCEIPSHAKAVSVTAYLPVPQSTTSISQRLSGPEQMAEFSKSEKKICWKIKKIPGKSEVSAHFTLIGAKERELATTELGPVALTFELSGFVSSGLCVRFLRVYEHDLSYVPTRWIRYITTGDSYVCKI